jgi:putative FmdB family regulatory protein
MILLYFVPTYEYECPKCPRVFEIRQRISEPALTTCDLCGGPIHRLLFATPFILKGGGWYVTDYPSEARKKALSSESGEKSSAPSDEKSSTPADASSPSSTGSSESSGGGPDGPRTSKEPATSKGSATSKEPAKSKDTAKKGSAKAAKD